VGRIPGLLDVIKYAGALWLLWLAFQFMRTSPSAQSDQDQVPRGRPLRFHEAVLFQWVNPKAWTLALAVATGYVGLVSSHWLRAGLVALVFLVMTLVSTTVWMLAGEALHHYLKGPRSGPILSYLMAGLIAATAIVIVLS
jgi:threonine/homoserine/homoserine lactone efflux protein